MVYKLCMIKQSYFKLKLFCFILQREEAVAFTGRFVINLSFAVDHTHIAVNLHHFRTGYHLIARETGVPVYLGYFDWKRKRVGRGQKFPLTDDAAADTRRIQEIYESMDLGAKYPEKYVTH